MKYCLSSRQPSSTLKKIEEILVKNNDYRVISDLFVNYPEQKIILDVPNNKFEELQDIIKLYSETNQKKFCCKIYDLNNVNWFVDNNIQFYYGYPVNSFYDVQALIALGVEYISITAPLTFHMNDLSKFKVKFRMVPNVTYDAYIPRINGLQGQWVRPEDVKYYEKGIYIFDFEDADLQKERTLYHIYAENKQWPGNLNLLFTNFNIDVDNKGIIEDIGKIRSNCRQKCMSGSNCHICETAIKFERFLYKYKKDMENRELQSLEK